SRAYNIVRSALAASVSESGQKAFNGYQAFEKFNLAPYRSSSHGNHYLNNYANDIGTVYGDFENAGKFPVGSILFKDSFSVAANNEVILGPLFIMQKMQSGFNPVSGDWKYVQINPTGEFLGETNGTGSEKVEYCIGCHLTREEHDHLFFLPEEYRVSR
ncbi:MAG: cytochrome P460 family protein, partial [bacterium]